MSLIKIADPTTEPVTLAEIKSHLKLETTYYDAIIPTYITVARQMAEHKTGKALAPQTWKLTLDEFPDGGIYVPIPPISTVSTNVSISYYNTSAALVTLDSSYYFVDDKAQPAYIAMSTGLDDWPDTNDQINAVTVQFVCGYTTCPENIKHWIKMRVGAMIETPEAIVTGEGVSNLRRDFVDGLLDTDRMIEI